MKKSPLDQHPRPEGRGYVGLFFVIFTLVLPICSRAQEAGSMNFPAIRRLDSRDTGFKQYISDVEGNRKRLTGAKRRPEEIAEHLTIYRYTPAAQEDIFFLAARCNIPYSALASLNRLGNPVTVEAGKTLLLPSCPGIFIPSAPESDLEKLLGAGRLSKQEHVNIKLNSSESMAFYFFPGDDFSATERLFFLNAGFRFPLQTFRITSSYGIRQDPITGNTSMHRGLDLAAAEGTPVLATADGIVADIGENPVYGNYILISHGEKWTSLYGHLQKAEVTLRTVVKSGTLIGRVGSTGLSTGPHLHFELRQDGRAHDPAGKLRP